MTMYHRAFPEDFENEVEILKFIHFCLLDFLILTFVICEFDFCDFLDRCVPSFITQLISSALARFLFLNCHVTASS